MKAHLHDEQFDGQRHATCGRVESGDQSILVSDDFSRVLKAQRCGICERAEFPHGCGYAGEIDLRAAIETPLR